MSEFSAATNTRDYQPVTVMPSALPHRRVDGFATWLRARFSLATAARRRRRAMGAARAAVALTDEFRRLDDAALDARRRAIVTSLRRHGLSTAVTVQALALVRETCHRRLGMFPYPEQLAGGYALLHNAAIEMDTGEGKTLTSILPAAIHAFCGRTVHMVTANDYLAARDGELLRPALEALGVSVGVVTHGLSPAERREAYSADVTFVCNKEVAFDYLRDRLISDTVTGDSNIHLKVRRMLGVGESRVPVLRGLDVAIIDEVDSVLVDDAGTPLLISADAPNDVDGDVAGVAFDLATNFVANKDFIADPHGIAVELTDAGCSQVDAIAKLLGSIGKHRIRRYELVRAAVTAIHRLEQERHYLVRDGKILIIDEYSGRIMADRYWGHDLHHMVELKEGCPASGARKSLASISFQRFFRSYRALSGMSGTIIEVAVELNSVYGLSLTRIPRSHPLRRSSLGRTIFSNRDSLWADAARQIRALYQSGRPVLIGVRTVEEAERGHRALDALAVPHGVLSAAHDQQEAEIVARAGQRHAVTIATNMAGRGTDIRLGAGVTELGGLVVMICERHDEHRIDRQLMGRCARQGDPGAVMELLSQEDHILKLTSRGLRALGAIFKPAAAWPFRHAQWRTERENARRRRRLVSYDEQQRKVLAFAGGLD